jgi:hypothetical protein
VVHRTEQPEDAADHPEKDAEDPQDRDGQQPADEEQHDSKGDHEIHIPSPWPPAPRSVTGSVAGASVDVNRAGGYIDVDPRGGWRVVA